MATTTQILPAVESAGTPLVLHSVTWDDYEAMLRKMYGVVKDRGIVLIHMITRGAKPAGVNFRKSRPEHRLFRKYIFPGGELGNVGDLVKAMEASRLEVHDVEGWRDHYAKTLKRWSQALAGREDEAVRLVGAERYRLWMAYMVGMGLGFKDGTLRLFQVVEACSLPVVARVNGHAMAPGLSLLSVVDLAVAADHAQFGLPVARVGLVNTLGLA
jgi:cyclopropane fatty-acyl-phospholipid synthase-like methyltransferase